MRGVLAQARRIGRVELVRSARTVRGETNKLVGIGIGALFVTLFSVIGGAALVLFGHQVPGLLEGALPMARGAAASAWLFAVIMVTFRAVTVHGEIDQSHGMLTTVSPRAIVLGLLFAEGGRFLLNLGLPMLVIAGALSYGTGAPLAGFAFIGVGLTIIATALPVGYALGQIVRYLSRSVPVVRANRMKLSVVAMIVYFLVFIEFGRISTLLAATPIGWFADPVTLAIAGVGSQTNAGLAVAGSLVAAPVCGHLAYKLAVVNWYADTVELESADEKASSGAFVGRVGNGLTGFVSRPTATVVRTTWLRARRMPFKLTFAFVPLFMFFGYLVPSLQRGTLPEILPVMIAGYGALAAGAAFTLNPLGDEGSLLPVTIGTRIGGTRFIRGRLLASWLLSAVPLVALTIAGGVAAGTDPIQVAYATVYAGLLVVLAPVIAVGLGMGFPNFETQRVMMNREAVVPSVFAFLAYMVSFAIIAAPGGVGFFVVSGSGFGGVLAMPWLWLALTAILGLVAGGPAYLYAVTKFDRYEVAS